MVLLVRIGRKNTACACDYDVTLALVPRSLRITPWVILGDFSSSTSKGEELQCDKLRTIKLTSFEHNFHLYKRGTLVPLKSIGPSCISPIVAQGRFLTLPNPQCSHLQVGQ